MEQVTSRLPTEQETVLTSCLPPLRLPGTSSLFPKCSSGATPIVDAIDRQRLLPDRCTKSPPFHLILSQSHTLVILSRPPHQPTLQSSSSYPP